MPEEQNEQREDNEMSLPEENDDGTPSARRRYFTRRNAVITAALTAILIVLLSVLSVVFYRYGVFDSYVKAQFVAKMAEIGIVFDADVFRLTVNPLELELKNATFNDRITGEKLFFIRDARIGLTVDNLYAWQLSRDISVNSTDINGAEERENRGLDQADKQLHEIEHKQKARPVEQVLSAEDISKETNGKGERSNRDGENFDQTDHEENE